MKYYIPILYRRVEKFLECKIYSYNIHLSFSKQKIIQFLINYFISFINKYDQNYTIAAIFMYNNIINMSRMILFNFDSLIFL